MKEKKKEQQQVVKEDNKDLRSTQEIKILRQQVDEKLDKLMQQYGPSGLEIQPET